MVLPAPRATAPSQTSALELMCAQCRQLSELLFKNCRVVELAPLPPDFRRPGAPEQGLRHTDPSWDVVLRPLLHSLTVIDIGMPATRAGLQGGALRERWAAMGGKHELRIRDSQSGWSCDAPAEDIESMGAPYREPGYGGNGELRLTPLPPSTAEEPFSAAAQWASTSGITAAAMGFLAAAARGVLRQRH